MRVVGWLCISVGLLACSQPNPAFEQPTDGDSSSTSMGTADEGTQTSLDSSGASDPSTTEEPTTSPSETGDDGPSNSCCEEVQTSGCKDVDTQMCVCKEDPFCCDDMWDSVCVEMVDVLDCGECGVDIGPCCEGHRGPGCGSDLIEDCVCNTLEAFMCCEEGWQNHCAALAVAYCAPACPSLGNCCENGPQSGCGTTEVLQCICDTELDCCFGPWGGDNCIAIAIACGAECPR